MHTAIKRIKHNPTMTSLFLWWTLDHNQPCRLMIVLIFTMDDQNDVHPATKSFTTTHDVYIEGMFHVNYITGDMGECEKPWLLCILNHKCETTPINECPSSLSKQIGWIGVKSKLCRKPMSMLRKHINKVVGLKCVFDKFMYQNILSSQKEMQQQNTDQNQSSMPSVSV